MSLTRHNGAHGKDQDRDREEDEEIRSKSGEDAGDNSQFLDTAAPTIEALSSASCMFAL
jgi:hypothetical protein